MKNRFNLKSKAFTLTETIIAAAVLGIAIIAIMQVFPVGVKTAALSRQTTVAINLGQEVLEETTSQVFDDINAIAKTRVNADPGSPYYDYYKQVDVTFVDANMQDSGTDTGLKKVTVTIFWPDSGGEKQVSLPTLISRK